MRVIKFEKRIENMLLTVHIKAIVSGQLLQVTRTADTKYIQSDQIEYVSACLRRDGFNMLGQEVQLKLEQSLVGR